MAAFSSGNVLSANPGDVSWEEPASLIDPQDRGYVGPDLEPPPPRVHEAVVGPVSGPLVRRLGGSGVRHKHLRTSRPQGFLSGKTIYLSPGHGWTYNPTNVRWETQRPNSLGIVEDFSNAETMIQLLVPYLWNASAHVVPLREMDMSEHLLVIDDGDVGSQPPEGVFEEVGDPELFLDSTQPGYGRLSLPLTGTINPFEEGGNRLLVTTDTVTAMFRYAFRVPAAGFYNVYVSYSAWSGRASDAHYVVRHPGGEVHFRVDQRHHGSTWVLLGRFYFDAGLDSDQGAVELWNDSTDAGSHVSADAVRIGGGLGVMDRGGGTSGHPRYLENSRYHAQYVGAPTTVYARAATDRDDDVGTRPRLAAWVNEAGEDSLYFSWHSDAGGGTGTSTWVYWPNAHGSCDGTQATAGSADLADLILAEIVGDIRAVWDPGWTNRGRRCAWFGELNPSNNNEMPAALLEAVFHDRQEDVDDYGELVFRRIMARAVYQGMVRYFAQRDGVTPALAPEPPTAPAARNLGPGLVEVTWDPPDPDPAGGDAPQSYRLYRSPNGMAFDEGLDVGSQLGVVLDDIGEGELVFFQITAVNPGGESLPSRVVGVMVSPTGRAPVLLVDSFDREDPGLLWAQSTGTYLGTVNRMVVERMVDPAILRRHGPEVAAHGIPFDSAHHRAVEAIELEAYHVVDMVAGRGLSATRPLSAVLRSRLVTYVSSGGNLLLSGSHAASQLAGGDAADEELLHAVLGAAGTEGAVGAPVAAVQGDILDGISDFALHRGGPTDLGAAGVQRGYDVGLTDVLTPTEAAVPLGQYGGGGVAALRLGAGPPGAAVLLGFPLEGVVDPGTREEIMGRILDFFGVEPPVGPDAGVDAGQETDASTDATCVDCPCDSGCGCALSGDGATRSGVPLMLGILCGLLWARTRRSRSKRSRRH